MWWSLNAEIGTTSLRRGPTSNTTWRRVGRGVEDVLVQQIGLRELAPKRIRLVRFQARCHRSIPDPALDVGGVRDFHRLLPGRWRLTEFQRRWRPKWPIGTKPGRPRFRFSDKMSAGLRGVGKCAKTSVTLPVWKDAFGGPVSLFGRRRTHRATPTCSTRATSSPPRPACPPASVTTSECGGLPRVFELVPTRLGHTARHSMSY